MSVNEYWYFIEFNLSHKQMANDDQQSEWAEREKRDSSRCSAVISARDHQSHWSNIDEARITESGRDGSTKWGRLLNQHLLRNADDRVVLCNYFVEMLQSRCQTAPLAVFSFRLKELNTAEGVVWHAVFSSFRKELNAEDQGAVWHRD